MISVVLRPSAVPGRLLIFLVRALIPVHQPLAHRWRSGTAARRASLPARTFESQCRVLYLDDESGWHYNHFRYYDPAIGRYTSPDPLGLTPAPDDHGYVPSPCAASDPLGLAGDPAAIMPPKPMLALKKALREPPNIGTITSRDAIPGEEFNMVLSAPQSNTRPGGFGSFDDIPNQSFAREQLAIRSDWKPDVPKLQRYRFPDGDPIRIQESIVGPQFDPALGRELPGGGTQLEILNPADRARLIPVGDPADLPC